MSRLVRCLRCGDLYRRGYTGLQGCPHCSRRDEREYEAQEERRAETRRIERALWGCDRSLSPTPPEKNPHAVALGREGGRIGGRARARNLTPEQLSAIGRKGAEARWGRKSEAPDA